MWKTIWFWKLLLTYATVILMLTNLAASHLGIMEFAGIEPPELPTSTSERQLEEPYSGYGIKAAIYAIVAGILLFCLLLKPDSQPTEVRKANIVDLSTRVSAAAAAVGCGLYWLGWELKANPIQYLQAFGAVSLIIFFVVTVYLIISLVALYVVFVSVRWVFWKIKHGAPVILRWMHRKLRAGLSRASVILRWLYRMVLHN